jgi:hypothetical protein
LVAGELTGLVDDPPLQVPVGVPTTDIDAAPLGEANPFQDLRFPDEVPIVSPFHFEMFPEAEPTPVPLRVLHVCPTSRDVIASQKILAIA